MIAVIMGSTSDLKVMEEGIEILKKFDVPHEVRIISAHRTPDLMREYAMSARERGIKIIIAGAGGAAHLPGMTAAWTTLPIIGVPVSNGVLKGEDALLSIVQMPRGIPVATVAIDNSTNAALLAIRMLSTFEHRLVVALEDFQAENAQRVINSSVLK
ncbi:MAG: 5-(carboxyamino)imidazole ribonucleotide mutase [Bacteriovoracaceae bacterium]|nr:5-(carboxyamino)imidazole ribonucleotide mutase [Bacteriovoracaceae bacterium]